jgi:CheY-like chemotaxis protein
MARISVIEDDHTMAGLLQTLLELDGHEVVVDEPQSGLLERVGQVLPDVLLMDVNLNQADGIEILRDLRNQALLRGIRVIMSSGLDMERECLAAGADAFLMKPYDPSELTDLVRTLTASGRIQAREGAREP